MNKKVLSALLFGAMVASTGTFTSCIDNDEPAGIEELRGAKAELIRAKVAVEEANAQYKLAEAEYEKARAATEQANAQYRLAEVKWMEAKAEYAAAETAEKKAYAEKQIALYKLEMEQAAEASKKTIADLKTLTAQAEYAYEVALKQIEVAKTLGVNFDEAAISALEGNVKTAYQAVYMKAEGEYLSLAEKVRTAQEDLYNAQLNKANGLVPESTYGSNKYVPELKQSVKTHEAKVAAAKETVTKLESFLEKDVETTDWRAELETLSDSIEILGKAIDAKQLEITKALNSEKYLAADQKVNGVTKDGNVLKDGTVQLLEKAVAKYNATAGEKKLNLSQIKVSVNGVLEGEINAAMTALGLSGYQLTSDAQGNKYILIENTKETNGSKKVYYQPAYETELTVANGYTPAKALEEIEAWTKILNEAAIDANEIEQFKRELAAVQKNEHEADSVYNVDLLMWKSALAVMDGKAATATIPKAETKKATDAIAAYNTKVNALSAAVTGYNDTYQDAYKAKYNEYYNEVYFEALKIQAETDLADSDSYLSTSAAQSAINNALIGLTTTAEKIVAVEALYVTRVQDNPATTDVNEATKAQERVNKRLAENKENADWAAKTAERTNKVTWENNAKAFVNSDAKVQKTLTEKKTTMDTAKTAVADAHSAMKNAVDVYRTLAKDYYALVPAEGAKNVPSTPATYVADEETSSYKMNGAAITAEDEGKMVSLALSKEDADKVAAWNKTSEKAFGEQGRYVVPSNADVQGGSLYAWLQAQKDLQNLQDEIAATDKLDEVKKALAEGKTTLLAEEKANLALFADLDAAIKAADKANEAAKEELAAIEETLAGDLNIEKAKLEAKKTAVTNVQVELTVAINNHLHLGDTFTYVNAEEFIKALEDAVSAAETEVINAERLLANAKVALEKAENGEFDAVADAQFKLDILMTEYNLKVAQYEKALANLQKALEIMAAE